MPMRLAQLTTPFYSNLLYSKLAYGKLKCMVHDITTNIPPAKTGWSSTNTYCNDSDKRTDECSVFLREQQCDLCDWTLVYAIACLDSDNSYKSILARVDIDKGHLVGMRLSSCKVTTSPI